MLDFRKFRS